MAKTQPLEKISVEEKLHAMELLLDDLCSKAGDIPPTAWHEELLALRQSMQERGEDQFEDSDAAKRNIRKKVS